MLSSVLINWLQKQNRPLLLKLVSSRVTVGTGSLFENFEMKHVILLSSCRLSSLGCMRSFCLFQTIVAMNNQTICLQSEFFPNPECYIPERWLQSRNSSPLVDPDVQVSECVHFPGFRDGQPEQNEVSSAPEEVHTALPSRRVRRAILVPRAGLLVGVRPSS